MEEICVLPSNKEEIDLNNIQCIKVEKSKRKKPKKRLKKFLIFTLLLGLLLSVALNYGKIKDYVSAVFDNADDIPTSQSSNLSSDSEVTDVIKPLFSFATTYVTAHEIINETKIQINYEDTVNFPKKSEIWQNHGENTPIVLIVNFSPNEAYSALDGYSTSEEFYSEMHNVKGIGEEICKRLNELSVPAIQLCNEGSNSLYESKSSYKEAIENVLLENPSIAYIVDISRSLVLNQDGSVSKEMSIINDSALPTVELWCGTNGTELTKSRLSSILFASNLAGEINESGNLFVSRQTVSEYTLMQDFEAICFRADIGSFATSYEDAAKCALLFAEHLARAIDK